MFPKKNNSVIFYFFFLAFSCLLMHFVNSFDLFSNIYNQSQRALSVHVKKIWKDDYVEYVELFFLTLVFTKNISVK